MRRAVKGAAAAAAALAFLAAPAVAQTPTAGKFRLSLGYDGRLLVKVLDMTLEQTADANSFTSSARLKSYGILAAFKKLDQRASAAGIIRGGEAFPREFHHQNIDGKKNRKVDVTWTGSDVVTQANPSYGKKLGDPPASRAQKLEAADPLTQLMRMSLADSQGEFCRGSRKFFDGKQRYDLEFLGRQTPVASAREKRLGLVNPVRCTVRFKEVAGFKRKKPGEENQGLKRPIVIGFAQYGRGGPWVMSFIDAETPLGHAVIDLQRLKTSGDTPD
jgi:hypothetical protein